MPYSRNLTLMASAVALAWGVAASNNAQAVNVLEVTGTFAGAGVVNSTSYQFDIDVAGPYLATLIDNGIFVAFDTLAFGVTETGGATVGSSSTPGTFTFDATPGSYTALVAGIVGSGTLPVGTYGLTVSLVPEPETWAMMLVGVGLVGWQLRRKVKSSAASRFV